MMIRLVLLLFLGVSSWQKAEALCNLPPDLWCENEEIALKCTGSLDYCANYVANNRRSKPFTVQLAFEAACPDSRGFIKRIYPRLLGVPFIYKDVNFEPVPWGLSKTEDGKGVYNNNVNSSYLY